MGINENPCAIFVAIRGFGLFQSRLQLIQTLLGSGWSVVVATMKDNYADQLADMGAMVEEVPFKRGGISPLEDVRAFLNLIKVYKKHQPHLIHIFHGKPIILGGLASYMQPGAKVVCTVTGLGHAFIKKTLLRNLSAFGYRSTLKRSDAVIFQNPDDMCKFVELNLVSPELAHLIISSGVDIVRYSSGGDRINQNGTLRVLMVTRLLWQKGVREFIDAAVQVKSKHPNVSFQLAGEWDPVHPDAVDKRSLDQAVEMGYIDFLGYLTDMPEQLRDVDVFVLPSYREGVPRVLLEAAACGVSVVTTDVPGCREVVIHGETGLLVPPRDNQALAQAIEVLINDQELRYQMGKNARKFVEKKFDIRLITQKYLEIYRSLGIEI